MKEKLQQREWKTIDKKSSQTTLEYIKAWVLAIAAVMDKVTNNVTEGIAR